MKTTTYTTTVNVSTITALVFENASEAVKTEVFTLPFEVDTKTAQKALSKALCDTHNVLKVKHIVILGHAQCGGIRAFVDKAAPLSPGDFIGRWMSMFTKPGETVEIRDHETMQDFVTRIEKAAVFRSLENLMTFPFVKKRVDAGDLLLHGAYFGVAVGSLSVLDKTEKVFKPVAQAKSA